MTKTSFTFNQPEYSDEALNKSISKLLDSNTLSSIATVKDNESYINTAYFCNNNQLDIYFLSDPNTQHIQNIIKNSSVALAIYDTDQSWDNNKSGLQIFGNCQPAKGTKLIEGTYLYLKRFSGLSQWIKHPDDFIKGAINSQLFLIEPRKLKLFDEDMFGEEVFISLDILKNI